MEIHIHFSAYFCILSVAFPESLDNVLSQPSSFLLFLPFALIMIIILIALVLIFAPCFRPTQHNAEKMKWKLKKTQRKGKIRVRFMYSSSSFFFFLFCLFFFFLLLLFIFVCFVLFGSTRLHKLLFSVFYVPRLFLRSSWHWLSCWCARSFSRFSLFAIRYNWVLFSPLNSCL